MIISVFLIIVLTLITIYAIKLIRTGRYIGIVLPPFSIVAVFLVVFPEYSNILANAVGVGRGADLLLYMLFVIVCLFSVLIHASQRQHKRMITEIIRAMALHIPYSQESGSQIKRTEDLKK